MPEALLDAVTAGDVDRVRKLLAAGADCNERDGDGATALMLAAHAGKLDMVNTLIDAGANVNATGERLFAWCTQPGVADALDRQRCERILSKVEQAR